MPFREEPTIEDIAAMLADITLKLDSYDGFTFMANKPAILRRLDYVYEKLTGDLE